MPRRRQHGRLSRRRWHGRRVRETGEVGSLVHPVPAAIPPLRPSLELVVALEHSLDMSDIALNTFAARPHLQSRTSSSRSSVQHDLGP
jgi:hypothetical protein